ncbi:MAG: C25 family cysteine peptidase [Candidatus Hodarchaeota archaeon]
MRKIRTFKSLKSKNLPDGFDATIHSEEPIVNIEELEKKIVIKYNFPGFYLSDDERDVKGTKTAFHQVNIAKTGFIAESGKPQLPSFGRYVQIPFNCDFKFTVEKGTIIQFDNINVLPAQSKLKDDQDTQEFEYDKSFYDKDELYPSELVKITGPFEIDEYNSLLVHVTPIQYNPAKKKLQGYGNITIKIDITPKKNDADAYPIINPKYNKEAYGNLFLNPRRGVEERLKINLEKIRIFPKWQGPEFLIIYAEIFKKAAEKLMNWKNMRGLITEMVSIDKVGNEKDKIKKYIRDLRGSLFSRLRYVLLFGDVDMIVSETIQGGPYGSNITDYYYSTKNDTSTTGNPYEYSWISIGRIPVRTAGEGMDVVDQIIAYEKNPPTKSEYYRRMAFAAYFQDDNGDGRADRQYMQTMEEIREHMITLGFDVERIYVSNNPNLTTYYDGTPIPNEVINAIISGNTATNLLVSETSEGQLIIGHRDHGNWDGWAHPSYKLTHLDNVTDSIPTMFYSINCLTGQFDKTAPTECFAEKILRIKRAAPSLIAATRSSQTWLNNDLMKALFDGMWGGVLATFGPSTASYSIKYNRLGDILNYGKSYLPITMSGGNTYIKDHFEIYHVVGDPTIELWKDEPCIVKIRAFIKDNYLYILLSSVPKNSVITIWLGKKMIKKINPTCRQMKISLKSIPGFKLTPIPAPSWIKLKDYIIIAFWAPGCRFVQVKVKLPRIR